MDNTFQFVDSFNKVKMRLVQLNKFLFSLSPDKSDE